MNTDEEELCEYEKLRLQHIRQNRDLMRTLGEWTAVVCVYMCCVSVVRVLRVKLLCLPCKSIVLVPVVFSICRTISFHFPLLTFSSLLS